MRPAPRILALCLTALLMLAPLAAGQGEKPAGIPSDAARVSSGNYTVLYWVTPQTSLVPGGPGYVNLVVNATNGSTLGTINATFASDQLRFENATLSITPEAENVTQFQLSAAFAAPNATGNASYSFTVETNGTSLQGSGVVLVQGAIAPVPPPGGIPWTYIWGGGVVLLVAVAIGAYAMRQRAVQRKMRGRTRSAAMREMELEDAAEKKPEQAAQIRQEIREQEVVREKRRELQILEAKRADVLKGMDLLKKRHEMGALSKLQYDTMLAKRQGELQRIEAEIAQMEAEDAGGSAAA